jgi:hypothetical protein
MGMISPTAEQENVGAEKVVVLQSTRFSGLENKPTQGSKIPVGYGRLRIGSKLVMQHKKPIEWSVFREIENTDNFGQSGEEYLNPTT